MAPSSEAGNVPEIILENYLLKKGSRHRFWHDRYVVFTSDNVLLYYNRKNDPKPKGTLAINSLLDCEISDLFVEKYRNNLIYCLKVSWTADADASAVTDGSQLWDDNSSLDAISAVESYLDSPRNTKKRLAVRRARSKDSGEEIGEGGVPPRSVDEETLTYGTKVRHLRTEDLLRSEDVKVPKEVEISVSTDQAHNRTSSRTLYELQKIREQEYLKTQFLNAQKQSKKKTKQKVMQGTKIAVATTAAVGVTIVTAGVGLLAGLVVLGIGSVVGGGSAAVGTTLKKKKDGELVIASHDYEKIRAWKTCLDAALASNTVKQTTWGQRFVSDGRKTRSALMPSSVENMRIPAEPADMKEKTEFEKNIKWVPLDGGGAWLLGPGSQGLRIFREEGGSRGMNELSVEGRPCPPMKAHLVLNTSPVEAFLCLMSYGRIHKRDESVLISPNSGQRSSFSVIETIDDHTDVIHLIFRPLYLFPSWTTARDFVLYRYWRLEPDGSYVICYESIEHELCPLQPGFVRGLMHQAFSIAPQKKVHRRPRGPSLQHQSNECFVNAVVQVDPRGWVPVTSMSFFCRQAYGDAFGVSALLQLLDLRDAIDLDRFASICLDGDSHTHERTKASDLPDSPDQIVKNMSTDSDDPLNYDFAFAGRESMTNFHTATGLTSNPPPLPMERWAEPDGNSFRVRGKNYKVDKKKINAGESIGRLVAVDVVTVDQPIYSGFSVHPRERIQLALEKERKLREKGKASDMPPYIFVVNIVLPGPPFYHGVFYFAIDDMSTIDGTDGSPSSRLCSQFFFGDSDEFRDKTFKLIPQIVQGNFLVRKAVGRTPAIMGKKLKQLYVKTNRSFEIIMDCGSSSVATGVIRLSLGYAKTLVIDMGFLFEGDTDDTLPERILGCVRMKHPEFDPTTVRKVLPP